MQKEKLAQEHRALEEKLRELNRSPTPNQEAIQAAKKRKLQIKDELARLERP